MANNPMTKDDPRYIAGCVACGEAICLGLTFEETHSTRKLGYIETDCGYIPSPHAGSNRHKKCEKSSKKGKHIGPKGRII